MAQTFTELGRIEAIRQLFEGTGFRPFEEPLWFEAKPQECIATASALLLEGIDFDLVYFPLQHLGRKAVLRATGELYAVLARPETLSVQLGVSAKLDFPQVQELWSGIAAAAKEHGYKRLSLELQPSRNGLTVALSATGRHSAAVTAARPKAQSKDLICVSGALGAAFLGLQVLERERLKFEQGGNDPKVLEQYKMLVGSYLRPELGAGTVAQLEESGVTPSQGYFVTRGLAGRRRQGLCRQDPLRGRQFRPRQGAGPRSRVRRDERRRGLPAALHRAHRAVRAVPQGFPGLRHHRPPGAARGGRRPGVAGRSGAPRFRTRLDIT